MPTDSTLVTIAALLVLAALGIVGILRGDPSFALIASGAAAGLAPGAVTSRLSASKAGGP